MKERRRLKASREAITHMDGARTLPAGAGVLYRQIEEAMAKWSAGCGGNFGVSSQTPAGCRDFSNRRIPTCYLNSIFDNECIMRLMRHHLKILPAPVRDKDPYTIGP